MVETFGCWGQSPCIVPSMYFTREVGFRMIGSGAETGVDSLHPAGSFTVTVPTSGWVLLEEEEQEEEQKSSEQRRPLLSPFFFFFLP